MFQIWLDPDLQKTLSQEATYDDYQKSQFPTSLIESNEVTTLIGEGSPLTLDTEGISTHRIKVLKSPHIFASSKDKLLGIYILSGSFKIKDQEAKVDEFVLIEDADQIVFDGTGEIFVFSSPKNLSYKTYIESMH